MVDDLVRLQAVTKTFTPVFKWLDNSKKNTRAVDNVDLSIRKGEIFGLVGESGCGKSTTGRMIVRLLEPTSGKIFFHGEELTTKSSREMLPLRRNLQMVFQNPYGSLNPQMSVQQIIDEPLKIHKLYRHNNQRRVDNLLDSVGLSRTLKGRKPNELSGGQRQRVAIARVLALDPEFIVADEPVSSLDVSIQAQILNLLLDLKKKLDLTCLFISHDLSVVNYVSDRAAVMYLGKIVELAPCRDLYTRALHPYTKMLLDCVPTADPTKKFRRMDTADFNGDAGIQSGGCTFYPRCRKRMEICSREVPHLQEARPSHCVACHLYH